MLDIDIILCKNGFEFKWKKLSLVGFEPTTLRLLKSFPLPIEVQITVNIILSIISK